MIFLAILLLPLQISVINCCSEIYSKGICSVTDLTLDDLNRGGSVSWITTIICHACRIGVIDDISIYKLWTDYPNLRTIVLSFDGTTLCKKMTTLITVVGCTEIGLFI